MRELRPEKRNAISHHTHTRNAHVKYTSRYRGKKEMRVVKFTQSKHHRRRQQQWNTQFRGKREEEGREKITQPNNTHISAEQ